VDVSGALRLGGGGVATPVPPPFLQPPPAAASSSAAAASPSASLARAAAPPQAVGLKRERGVDLELPYFAKLLLVAAFAASHNPPDTDARYFSRRATGRRRATHTTSAAASRSRAAAMLAGPRAFTLERLLALFHALVHGLDGPATSLGVGYGDLFGQVATLAQLHLLTRVSAAGELDAPKFRCDLALESIMRVAATLELDLGKYLHDPAL
jgi:origin recognition complex subunit 5